MRHYYARQLPHGRVTTGNDFRLWANYFRFESRKKRDQFVDNNNLKGIVEPVKLKDSDHMTARRKAGFYREYQDMDQAIFELYEVNAMELER